MCIIPAYAALSKDSASIITPERVDPIRKNFLNLHLSAWEFEGDWYRDRYPDLRDAIASGFFPSGWHHFTAVGFFEGRFPTEPRVNDWYLSRYGDVAAAILHGTISGARNRFLEVGQAEGRIPTNPGINAAWYANRYVPFGLDGDDGRRSCTDHFTSVGYLSSATPWAPL